MVKNSSTIKGSKKNKGISKQIEPKSSPDAFSSTTEVTKKIKKIPKPSIRPPHHSKRSPVSTQLSAEPPMCSEHGSAVEFICKACFRELCGHCILAHTEHVSQIFSLKTIMKEYIEEGDLLITSPEKLNIEVAQTKAQSLEAVEETTRRAIATIEKIC